MKNLIIAFIVVCFAFSCSDENDIERNPLKIISGIGPDAANLLADGVSEVEVFADLPLDAENAKSVVEFKTNAGQFLEAEPGVKKISKTAIVTEQDGTRYRRATTRLVSEQIVKTATINAKVLDYDRKININFVNAFPQSIKVSAANTKILPLLKSETTFNVLLKRQVGIPTIGNIVTIIVTDSTGKRIGNIREANNLSNASGQCSFVYNLPEDFLGRIKVLAQCQGENNTILKDSTYVFSRKE